MDRCKRCNRKIPPGKNYCAACEAEINLESTPTRHLSSLARLEGDRVDREELTFSPRSIFQKRYRILEELGRGGMGVVYKAWDQELEITVAIKMIYPHLVNNPHYSRIFKREVINARRVSHENVVRIYDFGVGDNINFISMDYIPGKNLREYLKEKKLPIPDILNIINQVVRGLKAAHHKDIVHRDLKPQNIMIDPKGRVTITDFGLSQSLSVKDSGTVPICATPEYIPPEVARGERGDKRSDVYSLGIILYEMITGRNPFHAESVMDYLAKHVSEKPRRLSLYRPRVPAFLESLVMKAIRKDKEKRFASAGEVKNFLEKHQRIYRLNPINQLQQQWVRGAIYGVLFVLAGFLLVTGVRTLLTRHAPAAPPRIAFLYFDNETGDARYNLWTRAFPDLLTTDMYQSRYFQVVPEDQVYQVLRSMEVPLEGNLFNYSSDTIRKLGRKTRADYAVLGSFFKSGPVVKASLKIRDTRSDQIAGVVSVDIPSQEDYFSSIDRMTSLIKARLTPRGWAGQDDIDQEISRITTASPAAVKYYIEGKRIYNEGRYQESMVLFKKAAGIDPNFAMAYRSLAWASAHLGRIEDRRRYFNRTFQLRENLSDRERLLIEADYYGEREETYGQALRAYHQLSVLYPQDREINRSLGLAHRFIEDWQPALRYLQKCVRNRDPSIDSYLFLSSCYRVLGRYSRARRVLKLYRRRFADHPELHIYEARAFQYQGRLEKALRILNAVDRGDLSPDVVLEIDTRKAECLCLMNRFREAERILEGYRRLDRHNLRIVLELRHLQILRGNHREAVKILEDFLDHTPELATLTSRDVALIFMIRDCLGSGQLLKAQVTLFDLWRRGLTCNRLYLQKFSLISQVMVGIETGQTANARRLLQTFGELAEKSVYPENRRLLDYFNGLLDHRGGEYSSAERHFRQALESLPENILHYHTSDHHLLVLDALARTYRRQGKTGRAVRIYRSMTRMTAQRIPHGDIYVRAFYHLGVLYQQRGDTRRASRYLRIFLEIWKNADGENSEVIDAVRRLRKLGISS